jgi:hypothetical protein
MHNRWHQEAPFRFGGGTYQSPGAASLSIRTLDGHPRAARLTPVVLMPVRRRKAPNWKLPCVNFR